MPRTCVTLEKCAFRAAVRRLERLRLDAEKAGDLGVVLQTQKELNRLRAVQPASDEMRGGACPHCELVAAHLRPVLACLPICHTSPGWQDRADAPELARIAAGRLRDLIEPEESK